MTTIEICAFVGAALLIALALGLIAWFAESVADDNNG